MKCPRCDADTVRVMTKSPVGDVQISERCLWLAG